MKVIAVNGSSNPKGNTAIAIDVIAEALAAKGISTDRIEVGQEPLRGCVACGGCRKNLNRRCVFDDDLVNPCLEAMIAADGIVLASPVYFAGITGPLKSLLDRAYFVAGANGGLFRHKIGAAAVAVRRAGSATALDQLLKFFGISGMTVPGSNYWAMIYGMTPGEAAGDVEGRQCLRLLGENMAWLLQLVEYGKGVLPPPPFEEKVRMNFIR